jgi:hypothetical protein
MREPTFIWFLQVEEYLLEYIVNFFDFKNGFKKTEWLTISHDFIDSINDLKIELDMIESK